MTRTPMPQLSHADRRAQLDALMAPPSSAQRPRGRALLRILPAQQRSPQRLSTHCRLTRLSHGSRLAQGAVARLVRGWTA